MAEGITRQLSLKAAVRKRPAMYFGNGAPTVIPAIATGVLDGLLELASADYKGPVKIELRRTSAGQQITFFCAGLVNRELTGRNAVKWLLSLAEHRPWEFGWAAAASSTFGLTASDRRRTVRLRIVDGDRSSVSSRSAGTSPFLKISFQPHTKTFGHITQDEIFKIAGCIRDQAALHPGLFISLRDNASPGELGYYYPEGLRSLLFEADYQRHSFHLGTLSFRRRTKKMNVEGHLRLVHAGVPFVRSYVNFKPTQGGAHVEGLGDALRDLFPDSTRGCRELEFVTNPDTGARVKVPHSFIGALHLRSPKPQYGGPTRDILIGDDVREFVHKAASEALRRQWDALEKAKRKAVEQCYRKMKASGQMGGQ
jgi:DNA gyrase/topoisomerase IV subunit B